MNKDQDIDQYFADLLIDIHNDCTPEFGSFYNKLKRFHTLFGQPKDFESKTVVINLADNVFKHQITLSDKTVPSMIVPVSYIFNLLTDLRYNDAEFKGLFIDSGISTLSMKNIG